MRVEASNELYNLSDLKAGSCFVRGERYYIKTTECDADGDIQVVDLNTGELHRYPPDNVITPVKAKMQIE